MPAGYIDAVEQAESDAAPADLADSYAAKQAQAALGFLNNMAAPVDFEDAKNAMANGGAPKVGCRYLVSASRAVTDRVRRPSLPYVHACIASACSRIGYLTCHLLTAGPRLAHHPNGLSWRRQSGRKQAHTCSWPQLTRRS